MEWILIITMWSGATDGGVAVSQVDGMTKQSCEAAKQSLEELYEKVWGRRKVLTGLCIKRKGE